MFQKVNFKPLLNYQVCKMKKKNLTLLSLRAFVSCQFDILFENNVEHIYLKGVELEIFLSRLITLPF